MNVYISADVEGVAGVADWSQIIASSDDYAVGRELMIGEVNAAIEGAFAGGADRVVVNDAHARMTNLVPQLLDQRAQLILGRYKPLYMLQGLDGNFDAVFFVGYHGAIGAPQAILSHSYNPNTIWEAKVDGQIVGEIGINALVAEYFGVPIRLVSGDQSVALEARALIPGVEVAEVKRSFSRYSAESLSPEQARAVIRQAAQQALAAVPNRNPVWRAATVELTFMIADMADMAQWVQGVERVAPRTVTFTCPDGLEAYRTFYTVLTLAKSLAE